MTATQLKLGFEGAEELQKKKKPDVPSGRANKLDPQDRAFHDWYRFVLSFPPHLVRDYIFKFPGLVCRAIAAQYMDAYLIALFEFEQTNEGIRVSSEKHYRLVKPDELSLDELQSYFARGE